MYQGEFSDRHASWYLNAAYFYKWNEDWCKSNSEKFWDMFHWGSDDDIDYYQPDHDLYGTEFDPENYDPDSEDDSRKDEFDADDKKIIARYKKERKLYKKKLAFPDVATPVFIKLVWDNIKNDPKLLEGASFWLESQAY
jgi:hypothetical protein